MEKKIPSPDYTPEDELVCEKLSYGAWMLYNWAYHTFTAQDQLQAGAVDGISGVFLLPA